MIPSTTIKPHSRSSATKRKLEDIRISPEPVPPEDILLRGESDDDSDGTRAWKKSKREAFARHYLEHGWVPIMTAKLKGPFEYGWKNPWAKRKTERIEEDLAESSGRSVSPSVRRVSNKIVKPRIMIPISKGSSVRRPLARSSRTDFQHSTLSKLSSRVDNHRSKILGDDEPQNKQSPTILPPATSALDSPSYQLQQQLHEASSQELVKDFPRLSPGLEDAPQIVPIASEPSSTHRLPNRRFQHQHQRSPDINGSTTDRQIGKMRLLTDGTVVRTKAPERKLRLSEDRSEEISNPSLNLEDELNLVWNNAKLFDSNDIPVLMEWRYAEAESDTSKGSIAQQETTRKRFMFYGDKPIILKDGRVNQFSTKHLKDIRTKLSNGLTKVQQDFDTIKASGNFLDIIACCEITLQLAQTLEKVDCVRRSFSMTEGSPKSSKSGFDMYDTLIRYQDQVAHSVRLNGVEISDAVDSDEPLIEQYKKAEKKRSGKRIDPISDAPRPAKHIYLEQDATVASPDFQNIDDPDNDGDVDMTEASDLGRTDVPSENLAKTKQTALYKAGIPNNTESVMRNSAHQMAAEPTVRGEKSGKVNVSSLVPGDNVHGSPSKLLLKDVVQVVNPVADTGANHDNVLTTTLNAKDKGHDKLSAYVSDFDRNGLRLAGVTFVEELGNPIVKSLGNEISITDKLHFADTGSTQINTPDSPQLFVSSSQQLQVRGSPDDQNQRQNLAKASRTFESIKQTPYHSPLNTDLNRFKALQAAVEAEYEIENHSASLSTQQKHHEQDIVVQPKQPQVAANSDSKNIPIFTDRKPKKISRTAAVIELNSESDGPENDAQYQPTLKPTGSRNDETLDSIHEVRASDGVHTTNSNSGTDKSDTAQAAQPNVAADGQSQIEKFTSYLQNVHHKVWKKTAQLNQQRPETHLSNDSLAKPPSPAGINIPQIQDLNRNCLPNSPNHPRPARNGSDPNTQPALQSDLTGTHTREIAAELPSVASTSTMKNKQILSQGANIIQTSSDPRFAFKNKISFYGPTVATTVGASATQQPTDVYKFTSRHPASQPVMRNGSPKFIGHSGPMSRNSFVPRDKPKSSGNTTKNSAGSEDALLTLAQTSIEDAQRRTPPMTEAEERDALDAATSLLGIWDVDKEASAI